MKLIHKKIAGFLFFFCWVFFLPAQESCESLISDDFIRHERDFRVPVGNDDVYFEVTFYKNYTYRVVICSEDQEEQIEWDLIDINRNLLFSNVQFDLSPYWDFTFENTVECLIRIRKREGLNMTDVYFYMAYKEK